MCSISKLMFDNRFAIKEEKRHYSCYKNMLLHLEAKSSLDLHCYRNPITFTWNFYFFSPA